MSKHPLAEVFGFTTRDFSLDAERYRKNKLCPFNNKVPSCTKDKAERPLGVCSVYDADKVVITCPIRFRQDWLIAEDAASFFFPASRKRLAPQLIYKGGILHTWDKKQAIAVDSNFFNTLPRMDEVSQEEAEMAWLIYDLGGEGL